MQLFSTLIGLSTSISLTILQASERHQMRQTVKVAPNEMNTRLHMALVFTDNE